MRRTAAYALLGLLVWAPPALAGPGARVHGDLSLEIPGAAGLAVGPIVVYLDAVDDEGSAARPGTDLVRATVKQSGATFSPAFQVVAVGQTVDMPNTDSIYHNVFSYSRPNAFDLGTYPAGESRSVRFDHPGIVRVYCSIHEGMNATIVVAPTRYFTVLRGAGAFEIDGVPPGRYRLRTWSEKLPDVVRDVTVGAGPASVRLVIKPRAG